MLLIAAIAIGRCLDWFGEVGVRKGLRWASRDGEGIATMTTRCVRRGGRSVAKGACKGLDLFLPFLTIFISTVVDVFPLLLTL